MSAESSRITLLACLAAGALLAAALVLPWFTVDFSSGRRTPAEGLQAPEQTGVQHKSWSNGAFAETGDAPPADPEANAKWSNTLGWCSAAAGLLLGIAFLGELPGIRRIVPRPVSLVAIALAFCAVAAAVLIGWFLIPHSYGLGSDPFAQSLRSDGYWRTSLDWGWSLAALAAPLAVIAWFAKYQAGWADPAAIEALAPARAARP